MRETLEFRVLLAAVTFASAVACGGSKDVGVSTQGDGACPFTVSYQGRTYQDVANVDFTVGEKLGSATHPPCNDTGDTGETEGPRAENAYGVEGVSPAVAIAVGTAPGDAVFVASYSGTELPPEVKELLHSKE